MKKKFITWIATAIAVILSPVCVFAASSTESGSLSGAQFITGVVILIAAITIPIIKKVRKSKLNK